ncbi:MAG: DUF167 domain-containing protein [Gemmatimonadota bacterium]|nr:MAG: DUF167 domain-containing protein [Gemmatimonadota bacterium]
MCVRAVEGGVEISVRAQPRASRSEVVGAHGDQVKIRIAAAPVDGAANAELIKLLAKVLGVSRSALHVVRGEGSRSKVVRANGIAVARARAALEL